MVTPRPVCDLLLGDHAWLPFSSELEQENVLGPWLREGLDREDKVIYVGDHAHSEVPGLFGQDLREEICDGRLTILSYGDCCLTGGMFDPVRMAESLGDEIKKAAEQEYDGIRVTGDLTWATLEPFGEARLLQWERRRQEIVPPSTLVTAVCQTDRRRCDPEQLRLLADQHEVRVLPPPEFVDSALTITRTYDPLGLFLSGDLDAARRTRFAEALNSVTPNGAPVHLDIAEVNFIGLDILREMTNYTRRRGPTSKVILERPPAHVRAMIETVGLARLPGVELGEWS